MGADGTAGRGRAVDIGGAADGGGPLEDDEVAADFAYAALKGGGVVDDVDRADWSEDHVSIGSWRLHVLTQPRPPLLLMLAIAPVVVRRLIYRLLAESENEMRLGASSDRAVRRKAQ